ncbi:hypothetical protein [Spartinivicinus poritis]|uniref:Uncharacterized protein n=1 Tax=Spartinivicinus poritis TaxID=2994640 RepID=A0ABT5U500_9GAMM|nr:hypothetical protein [Spartinivicinus sp. A2-2]MDE1461439.1 hypothetical protein [Spartinivicinus sp. A2-2]
MFEKLFTVEALSKELWLVASKKTPLELRFLLRQALEQIKQEGI